MTLQRSLKLADSIEQWDKSGYELATQTSASECDLMLVNVVNTTILVRDIVDTEVGQYMASIFTVQRTPESNIETLYSSSKVINTQIKKLHTEGKLPCLVHIRKIKTYYSI